MNAISTDTDALNAEARAQIYKVLAKSFLYPTEDLFDFIGSQEYTGPLLRYCSLNASSSELHAAIQDVCEMLKSGANGLTPETLEYEYNRLFAHLGSAKCPPYETEYGYDNVFQKTQAMADIAGFYRAYGLDVADVNAERVDFISTELEFMSFLALNEAYARESNNVEQLDICIDTQRKFLGDHLTRWITVFVNILTNATKNLFYQGIGRLTKVFLHDEAARLDIVLKEVVGPNKDLERSPSPFGCSRCVTKDARSNQI